MFSARFKRVGLHYTAFSTAIRKYSRQNAPSRGVSPRKKFADKANVESRVKRGHGSAEAAEVPIWCVRNGVRTAAGLNGGDEARKHMHEMMFDDKKF